MTPLEHLDYDALSDALRQRSLDGWLIYDFHDVNPMARRLLGSTGMLTRRVFIWLPAVGEPRLIVSRIDQPSIAGFPGEVDAYTTWQELHQRLQTLLGGRRIAIETSPENAVPYLDLVPAGVVELLTRLGVSMVSSAPLVTAFASRWSAAELVDHRHAAEAIAEIARTAVAETVGRVGAVSEVGVLERVLEALDRAGLHREEPPIVAFGPHAADPHYEPKPDTDRTLEAGDVVLVDLWARRSETTVWADQTWMGFAGGSPPDDVVTVWQTVVRAREAVIERLAEAHGRGERLSGAQLDQAARGVVTDAGYGEWFGHRTGHSIDFDLHGSGPHLDDFETHDVRDLLEGVGFSVEPGIYLPGRFGVRSEVNAVLRPDGPEVTPRERQTDLIRPA